MPTAEAINRLGTEALAVRDACLAALRTIDVSPDAYLYPGVPPIEVGEPPCDGMLAVYVPNISRLPTNTGTGPLASLAPPQQNPRVPHIRYTIVYASCVDVWGDDGATEADAGSLTAQTAMLLNAGWVLMNGVVHAVMRGDLFPDVEGRSRNWSMGDLTPLAVQGNSAGWSFDLTVQMDGFDPYV